MCTAECRVPPENGAADADEPLELDRHVLGQRADGVERAEVVGDRVKPAGVDELGAGAPRLIVVAQPHEVDELGLAGEVDVVGPGGRARGHHRLAVVDVGTDGGDDDPGRLGHGPQRRRVADVGHDHRDVGGQPLAQRVQLLAAASRDRPATGAGRGRQVLGGQRPGEPGGAEDDDVVLALSHRTRRRASRSAPARRAASPRSSSIPALPAIHAATGAAIRCEEWAATPARSRTALSSSLVGAGTPSFSA